MFVLITEMDRMGSLTAQVLDLHCIDVGSSSRKFDIQEDTVLYADNILAPAKVPNLKPRPV